jgi:tRNA 5-methylaminomethyl-2-thiouridine biosynthesis bifunctional protein
MYNPFPIKQANTLSLQFDKQNNAYSDNYLDIYFQPNIGLDEKYHVFLQGNKLPQNWQGKEHFTIAETGFGTGLNFLLTLQKWNETATSNQHLHYISCELHPFNKKQLYKVLSQFPQLSDFSQQLIAKYPDSHLYGFHRLHFKAQNATLTLIIGDATQGLKQLNANIDAWYLDGFAPSKNPDLWSEVLFKAIANLSHQGTTLATYTVARKIRNNLEASGFTIKKVKGFGQKREMLTATMTQEHKNIEKQPWAQTFKAKNAKTYTIIGAGIAGLTLAQKLCDAGKHVTLIDRQKQPCLETSGNPQAMVMPSFALNDSVETRFYLSAFLYAIRHYSPNNYHGVGVYELAFNDKQKQWQDKLLENFYLPQSLVKKHQQGLLYSTAGWLDTQGHAKSVFEQLQQKPNFAYRQVEINSIEQLGNVWQLKQDNSVVHTTECLVLANGINLKKLLPNHELPITPKHGQISYFKSKNASTPIADCPHIQLCKGYITPRWHGEQTMGATFDHIAEQDWYKTPQTSENHRQRNIELWNNTPFEKLLVQITSEKSRAGIRVTTPDHLPICGAVVDQQQFKKDYHDIRHGKSWKHYPQPQHTNNLYIFTGLGSRGFTSAPLLAESLYNQILGMPQVLNTELQNAINPNRFLFKSLKKSR